MKVQPSIKKNLRTLNTGTTPRSESASMYIFFFSRQELLVQTWKWLRMVGLLFLAEGLVIAKQYS